MGTFVQSVVLCVGMVICLTQYVQPTIVPLDDALDLLPFSMPFTSVLEHNAPLGGKGHYELPQLSNYASQFRRRNPFITTIASSRRRYSRPFLASVTSRIPLRKPFIATVSSKTQRGRNILTRPSYTSVYNPRRSTYGVYQPTFVLPGSRLYPRRRATTITKPVYRQVTQTRTPSTFIAARTHVPTTNRGYVVVNVKQKPQYPKTTVVNPTRITTLPASILRPTKPVVGTIKALKTGNILRKKTTALTPKPTVKVVNKVIKKVKSKTTKKKKRSKKSKKRRKSKKKSKKSKKSTKEQKAKLIAKIKAELAKKEKKKSKNKIL